MRIALAQLTSGRDVSRNLQTCRRLGIEAAEAGADWILFPENAPFLGSDREKLDVAETLEGPMVETYRDIARDTGCWVTLGSFPEESDEERTYNTQVLLDPTGSSVAVYRKMHLFDVEVPGGASFRESDHVVPGDLVVTSTVEIAGQAITIGLTVCYDLRFPEIYRALSAAGAEILTVPSAFTLQTGRDHWHPLLRARAIENQCWVLAPNQYGNHFGDRWSYGRSAAFDPWGGLTAAASDGERVVLVDVDLDYLADVRRRMPCLTHRRDL